MSVKAVQERELAPADDFQSLEEKVYRTIELLKEARQARSEAERTVARLREQMREEAGEAESLRRELIDLRKEREEVRSRVEKMLNQIDALTAEAPAR